MSNGANLILSWCQGDPCDPCPPSFGLIGTTFAAGTASHCVYVNVVSSSPPASQAVSGTISIVGGSSAGFSGTISQELPGSINWVAYPPLPFTPIAVPPGFDYSHIQLHLDWGARPVSADYGNHLANFSWGTVGISFDGGAHHNYGYAIV